jgi:hypothetical protein
MSRHLEELAFIQKIKPLNLRQAELEVDKNLFGLDNITLTNDTLDEAITLAQNVQFYTHPEARSADYANALLELLQTRRMSDDSFRSYKSHIRTNMNRYRSLQVAQALLSVRRK